MAVDGTGSPGYISQGHTRLFARLPGHPYRIFQFLSEL